MKIISLKKKSIVLTLIILLMFLLTTLSSGIGIENNSYKISSFEPNDGTLSGYVTDLLGNPIEDALIRVHFHGTYAEDYSDAIGYYFVTDIPICYCMKNVTCSKEFYKTEVVELAITENTTYDFIMYPDDVYPIIDGSFCNGWWNSPPVISFYFNPEIVDEIWFYYNGWHQYTDPFTIEEQGHIQIEYYWVDIYGMQSPITTFTLSIDYTPPNYDVSWEVFKISGKWYVEITLIADDPISYMTHYVDLYINDVLQDTVQAFWPTYVFGFILTRVTKKMNFGFGISDNACNYIIVQVNASDIESHVRSINFAEQYSYNFYLLRILEKFPLLQRLFDIIGRNIL